MTTSASTIRTFIAVNLPPELRGRLAQFQEQLRQAVPGQGLRWTDPDQIHLTLRFLGHVPETVLAQVGQALTQACQGTGPFVLEAQGAGAFPDLTRPRVVWVGLKGELDTLAQLQAAVLRATSGWGELEDRPFHPHLTLGRVKTLEGRLVRSLSAALHQASHLTFGHWQVQQVELMRSDLSPAGPRYSVLARVVLGSAQAG
jgi:2'-5' RNA ligase